MRPVEAEIILRAGLSVKTWGHDVVLALGQARIPGILRTPVFSWWFSVLSLLLGEIRFV
jgi:hypothetical protein